MAKTDPEMLAMRTVQRLFEGLSLSARKRVINWVVSKLDEEGESNETPEIPEAPPVAAVANA